MENENSPRTLGDYVDQDTRAIETPLSSPTETMWCLCDPTPSVSNWLERLPAGPISTWKDPTTHFLAQFFPPGRTTKLRNDFLMFQQHHENLALYDHEIWDDPRDLAKPVKAINSSQDVPNTSDCRLLELEDQISYLLKGSKTTPKTSSTRPPQAYANVAQTERMERFEEAIYKQREEIKERMTEISNLLKELTKEKSPEKVLVREEVSKPVTKYVNAISLVRVESDKDRGSDEIVDKDNMETY
ncbi:MAK10-like protein [Tanacetum coccineum]